MLDVLLESRTARPRRIGGTIASALLHALLISAAVALAHPTRGGAVASPVRDTTLIYVPPPAAAPLPPAAAGRASRGGPSDPQAPVLRAPEITLPDMPPIDVHDQPIDDKTAFCDLCADARRGGGGPSLIQGAVGGAPVGVVVDERHVDRLPRLVGRAIEPRYPAALRAAGVQGSVVVQFVVDSLGRVDMDGVQIVASPHALFTDAVREALARYRFVPGEVAGRRVATRVQLPFEFRLR